MTEYWAKEITKSVHRLGATSIGDIAGMKRTMRETVEASCVIDRGVVEEHHVGEDGTQKWLIIWKREHGGKILIRAGQDQIRLHHEWAPFCCVVISSGNGVHS